MAMRVLIVDDEEHIRERTRLALEAAVRKVAGLIEDFRFRDCRHTATTRMIQDTSD